MDWQKTTTYPVLSKFCLVICYHGIPCAGKLVVCFGWIWVWRIMWLT